MRGTPKGSLMIIGGHEAKCGEHTILSEVVARAGKRAKMVIVTTASQEPEELAKIYREQFTEYGIAHITVVDIPTRGDASSPEIEQVLADADVLFFTDGDQLRITSQIGDSLFFQHMHALYHQGSLIVGTSAGAAAMPTTMLIAGTSDSSQTGDSLKLASGLGLLDGVVIDSHFAERGRMSRLLGAVAQNPRNLGVGIDEDTAILVEQGKHFRVLGKGAVYVLDGASISYSSLSEDQTRDVVTIHGVTVHVLGADDRFDLKGRKPLPNPEE